MARSNRISYDADGNMLVEGIALDIREKTYKVSQEFTKKLKELELSYKTLAISEEEYYKKLEKLRDNYLQKGTDKWWTYTNKLTSYEDKLLAASEKAVEEEKERIMDVYSEIASHIYKTQEEVLKSQEAFSSKLKKASPAYHTQKVVFLGLGEGGGDLVYDETNLNDLEAEKKELKDYYNLLSSLSARGKEAFGEAGFSDFFNMVRDMSVSEGAEFAKVLLKESDDGFLDFVGDWNEIQSISEKISKELYKDDTIKAAEESISYMKTALEQYGLSVPEDFFKSGANSAIKFGEGFVSEIANVLDSIKTGFLELLPEEFLSSGAANVSQSQSSVFAPVYNLYGSGETVADMLRSATNQALVDKLRGGY